MQLSFRHKVLNRLANSVPVDRRRIALDRGVLSVTFDDFPRSAWLTARPILDHFGARATYYVSGSLCGQDMHDIPQYVEQDLEDLTAGGHEIGCHTFDHVSVFETTPMEYAESVGKNARFVRTIVPDAELRAFAYPYGHVWLSHRRLIADRFQTLRGIYPARRSDTLDRTLLGAAGLEERQRATVDWPDLIARAARDKAWLILFTHDVSDRPTPYGTRPDDLKRLLSLAAGAGLGFATVSEAWASIAAYPDDHSLNL